VAISVQLGRVVPSTILRRLGTYSRKNRLYVAFRELGRVVRTIFLLRYLSDPELRRIIHAATNKSEAFNKFAQWVLFGGDSVISEGVRDEQRKIIKYNHLLANLLIFHTLVTMTQAIQHLAGHGYSIDTEALATLSPYQTDISIGLGLISSISSAHHLRWTSNFGCQPHSYVWIWHESLP
jgi:TnpA family transposase